ncbi:MAG: YraN family protein [Chloroflexi bacterium]|nr:MAG: YraN family protein [Chloroflexota bacterium]
MASNPARGAAGESFVVGRLERAGYRVLDRNWRRRGGELDVVALDGQVLVFVEVKVRTGTAFGTADEAIGPRKLERLMTTAQRYIAEHEELHDLIWRVDLVAVTLGTDGAIVAYRHYQNVTSD